MAIVQSRGALTRLATPPPFTRSNGGGAPFVGLQSTYAAMYAAQPNIRTCVDFLSRNMAQIGLHAFRRDSDTDRTRLTAANSDVGKWLERPNPQTTAYRLMEDLMGDLGIYFNAYLRKVRVTVTEDAFEAGVRFRRGERRVMLVRLPPEEVWTEGRLLPLGYVWETADGPDFIDTSDIIPFHGYNPSDPKSGLSLLETLRQTLESDAAAQLNRLSYWQNAARIEGVIERPINAPKWTREQKQEWKRQWAERYAGPGNAGQSPVLEDGMTWKQGSWSSHDSEYVAARKLDKEECAAAYHIPLPMVGILEHATFSNIKEQHKQLYADTMGPWCQMIQQQLELGLLMEMANPDNGYFEFNIAEKLKGSFEEQSTALRVSVGRPFMTANEARARLNLPRITDDPSADELAAQQGGPAGPPTHAIQPAGAVIDFQTRERLAHGNHVERIVRASWQRQASRLQKVPVEARADDFDLDRATRELATDLTPLFADDPDKAVAYAAAIATDTYTLLVAGADAFAADREVPACTIH